MSLEIMTGKHPFECDEQRIWDFYQQIFNKIASALHHGEPDDAVTTAVGLLMKRAYLYTASLWTLRCHAQHDSSLEGAGVLRMLYDASLQALYILADASKAEERAELYLNYLYIEKDRLRAWFDKRQNPLAQRLSNSPRRATTEPSLNQKIDLVQEKYKQNNGKYRLHWYSGNLKCLAKSVGLEEEYEILQFQLSGAIHSSISATSQGAFFQEQELVLVAWKFVLRVLGRFAEYKKIDFDQVGLTADECKVISLSYVIIFEMMNGNR
jgi:hypothetical protein